VAGMDVKETPRFGVLWPLCASHLKQKSQRPMRARIWRMGGFVVSARSPDVLRRCANLPEQTYSVKRDELLWSARLNGVQ
jgi:hypothetical protein